MSLPGMYFTRMKAMWVLMASSLERMALIPDLVTIRSGLAVTTALYWWSPIELSFGVLILLLMKKVSFGYCVEKASSCFHSAGVQLKLLFVATLTTLFIRNSFV